LLEAQDPLRPEARLFDLGLDSLAMVSLLVELESEFEITFADDMLTISTFETATKLWEAVRSAHAEDMP
jgi:acyl carrier protein